MFFSFKLVLFQTLLIVFHKPLTIYNNCALHCTNNCTLRNWQKKINNKIIIYWFFCSKAKNIKFGIQIHLHHKQTTALENRSQNIQNEIIKYISRSSDFSGYKFDSINLIWNDFLKCDYHLFLWNLFSFPQLIGL